MNQAIQFPDRERWDSESKVVCFPALVNGLILTCAITAETLYQRFGEGEALQLFIANRWDLEEEAEIAIGNERYDNQGWIWLSAAK